MFQTLKAFSAQPQPLRLSILDTKPDLLDLHLIHRVALRLLYGGSSFGSISYRVNAKFSIRVSPATRHEIARVW